jgi:hypothetical protein
MGSEGFYPDGRVEIVKLTSHLHLVLRLRMPGIIPPLPSTSSWRGAYLSTGITLYLSLSFEETGDS